MEAIPAFNKGMFEDAHADIEPYAVSPPFAIQPTVLANRVSSSLLWLLLLAAIPASLPISTFTFPSA